MRHLHRSRIFRYGVAYAGLFFVSMLLVLIFLYSFTFQISAGKVEDRLSLESQWLAEMLDQCEEQEMVRRLNFHMADHPGNLGIYLMLDGEGKRLAGNLDLLPKAQLTPGVYTSFHHQDEPDSNQPLLHILATTVKLSRGCTLLVGHNYQAIDQIKQELLPAVAWSLGISFLLGVMVAVFLARRLARRLDIINKTSRAILEGNLDSRMVRTGSGDEFDHLSTSLNRMLDRIFALMDSVRGVTDNIAHDLRSPLSRMRSRMEVTLLSDRPCEEYKEVLIETVEDTDRLLATFNSLLTIARVESGAARDGFLAMDLGEVVSNTAEFYSPVIEENEQTLHWFINGDLTMQGNPDLLAQALVNLLDNAVKYAPKGAAIKVSARRLGNVIRLVVSDNGPGIGPHFREKAMQRFSRLDASRSKPGQGLGLSMVQVVAEIHGGGVELEDAQPGLRVVILIS